MVPRSIGYRASSASRTERCVAGPSTSIVTSLPTCASVRRCCGMITRIILEPIELELPNNAVDAVTLRGELTTNLPVMPERIDHATQSPAVFLSHREDLFRASFPRPKENSIRIFHSQ